MNFDDTARFFGPSHRMYQELFVAAQHVAKRMCKECRKREVGPRKRYCDACAKTRKRGWLCGKDVAMGENPKIGPLALKHLRDQKTESAITTLKLRFRPLVFSQAKGLRMRRRSQPKSTQRDCRMNKNGDLREKIDEAKRRLPLPELMKQL